MIPRPSAVAHRRYTSVTLRLKPPSYSRALSVRPDAAPHPLASAGAGVTHAEGVSALTGGVPVGLGPAEVVTGSSNEMVSDVLKRGGLDLIAP
jgi:hypothetical protein